MLPKNRLSLSTVGPNIAHCKSFTISHSAIQITTESLSLNSNSPGKIYDKTMLLINKSYI